MKIAHLTTVDLSLRYLLYPQLAAAKEAGEVVGISAPGPHVEWLEAHGIHHVPLHASTRGMNLLADVRAVGQLWKILREEKPDLLHTHNPKPGVYGRIVGRLAGVPIVMNTVHGLYATPESSLFKRIVVYGLEFVASRFSDMELIQNPEDLDLLQRRRITSARKLRLLGNGVDLERFNRERARGSRASKRAELGIEHDEVVAGFVGRLVEEKGLPELVAAAESLTGKVRFVVVGPGDHDKSDALPPSVIERGKQAGVLFLGMRSDVDDLYGAFDLFVLPSHREGFPRAAMEAAASGLPIVATDIRGCRQIVDDGVNGFLVPARDVVALARAIEKLAGDAGSRGRMGEASAVKAHSEFDEARVVGIVMDSYGQLAIRKGIAWTLPTGALAPVVRPAEPGDAAAVARLHATMIDSGFLASLGPRFLRVLYESLIESDGGVVLVADSEGAVVGFIAGAEDTGKFYREFLKRRLIRAGINLVPALIRPSTWMRLWETLRYGSESDPVPAELLSMAVAPVARRKGLGARLVDLLIEEAGRRGLSEMKVVVGADNHAAIALYEGRGFGNPQRIEVHEGTPSLRLTWSS